MAKTLSAKPGDNGFDPDTAQEFMGRILNLHTELETEGGRIRGEIGEVYDEAVEAGIPKKLLKEAIKQKRDADKTAKREEALETDLPGELDKLKQSLGMLETTPLGRAAIDRAEAHAN